MTKFSIVETLPEGTSPNHFLKRKLACPYSSPAPAGDASLAGFWPGAEVNRKSTVDGRDMEQPREAELVAHWLPIFAKPGIMGIPHN